MNVLDKIEKLRLDRGWCIPTHIHTSKLFKHFSFVNYISSSFPTHVNSNLFAMIFIVLNAYIYQLYEKTPLCICDATNRKRKEQRKTLNEKSRYRYIYLP